MALEWKYSTDDVDWHELSALYRAAPLGDKKPSHLQKVFSNSMFKCFVYENSRLVGAGRGTSSSSWSVAISVKPDPFHRVERQMRVRACAHSGFRPA